MSTGIGFGIGIPHASTDLISEVVGAFGRSKKGVNFDALDNQPVTLVMLHAAPLTRDPNSKGGPYTAGPFLGTQQYGILEVTDTGGPSVQCRFSGKRLGEGAKLVFQFSAAVGAIDPGGGLPVDPGTPRALVNISARGRITSPTDATTCATCCCSSFCG